MVDYTQPLTEHDVTVTMARQPHPDGPREVRHFTFTIPAASPSEAAYGAIQMGYGINEASGYQWKLADDEDGPRVRPAGPAHQLLALPLGPNDAQAATVRDYLIELLCVVWREDEAFSGKRPFGNSGWAHDIYVPMVKAGLITGTLDDDGYVEVCDIKAADQLIFAAIRALGAQPAAATKDGA